MAKLAINPGHCVGQDPGACSNGACEAEINKKVSEILVKKLVEKGHEVIEIHLDSLEDICAAANDFGAEAFISIHCNAAYSADAEGFDVFTSCNSRDGYRLAANIIDEFLKFDMTDRGIKTDSLYVTRNTWMPAVLVELGFITNDEDRARLLDETCQEEMANAIIRGLEAWL